MCLCYASISLPSYLVGVVDYFLWLNLQDKLFVRLVSIRFIQFKLLFNFVFMLTLIIEEKILHFVPSAKVLSVLTPKASGHMKMYVQTT